MVPLSVPEVPYSVLNKFVYSFFAEAIVKVVTIRVKTKTKVIVIFLIEASLCVMSAADVDCSF